MFEFWGNGESLRNISSYLQWISIALVFFSGTLQLAKFVIDRQEKALAGGIQLEREAQLTSKIDSLKHDIVSRQTEINELKKKTEFVDPFTQPLRTGTATVEVIIKSSEQIDADYMDRGGYIALGKDGAPTVVMASTQSIGKQIGNSQVLYRGVFQLDATDNSIGKPISDLANSDMAQIEFLMMPEGSEVLKARAICTFNSAVRIEIPFQPQMTNKQIIVARGIQGTFSEYARKHDKD